MRVDLTPSAASALSTAAGTAVGVPTTSAVVDLRRLTSATAQLGIVTPEVSRSGQPLRAAITVATAIAAGDEDGATTDAVAVAVDAAIAAAVATGPGVVSPVRHTQRLGKSRPLEPAKCGPLTVTDAPVDDQAVTVLIAPATVRSVRSRRTTLGSPKTAATWACVRTRGFHTDQPTEGSMLQWSSTLTAQGSEPPQTSDAFWVAPPPDEK